MKYTTYLTATSDNALISEIIDSNVDQGTYRRERIRGFKASNNNNILCIAPANTKDIKFRGEIKTLPTMFTFVQ